MRVLALMAAGFAALASPAYADRTVTSANAAYPSQQTITPFGTLPGASPTYAQVFASPMSGQLTSFSFTLTGGVGQIFAGIGTWNGAFNYTSGGGSPTTLWESSYVPSGAGTITFTPNVRVLDLTKYVAYISVYRSPDATGDTGLVLGNNSSPALRYFTFDNGAGSPSGNGAWTNYDLDVGDALFSFTVTNVPEPAEWALMIAGYGLAGVVARRRKSGLALAA
ncbi:hypothetical protein SPAN111604_05700 [Sphingomonas antarctica]|uniref:PEPxxWA-CTERM sorting domain-containing protein n=1 Tax=Sphingomonas antarctica TaxID=2040274 RepID=UPI0039E7D1BC